MALLSLMLVNTVAIVCQLFYHYREARKQSCAFVRDAKRAFQRRRQTFSAALRLGLGTLTTIASTAPSIGLLGTVFGIFGAFRGVAMARASFIAMVESALALALVTTTIGVAVAVPAVWCRNYLYDRWEVLESEMANAALEAATCLGNSLAMAQPAGICRGRAFSSVTRFCLRLAGSPV
ncbi:MAG: MotA/TolQ/ExbB proton channel family protein [Candidatus Sulfotelmatobacter sp.]